MVVCPHFPKITLFQMLTFLEKNSKERSKARLGAVSAGAKSNDMAATEAILDGVPASGTMSQTEVNEVSFKVLSITPLCYDITLRGNTL